MAVKALYDYTFPAADRKEVFGDDQLVYVHWRGNLLFCSAACFRAPSAMPFGDFVTEMVVPWAASDPDFDPASISGWQLLGDDVTIAPETTLSDAGVGHKSPLTFTTA